MKDLITIDSTESFPAIEISGSSIKKTGGIAIHVLTL
jgi:hypothetical protein